MTHRDDDPALSVDPPEQCPVCNKPNTIVENGEWIEVNNWPYCSKACQDKDARRNRLADDALADELLLDLYGSRHEG